MTDAQDSLEKALALAKAGRGAGALSHLREAGLDVLDPSSLMRAGRLAEDLGDPKLAEQAYDLACRKSPDEAAPHAALGRLLASQNRFEESLAPLRRAAELAPEDDSNLNNLSYALEKAGLYEEALEAGLKAHELGLPQAHRYESLVGLLEQMNRLDEAETLAQDGLAQFPDNAYLHYILARCERRKGKAEQAVQRLARARSLPADAYTLIDIHYELARGLDAQGRYAQAFAAAGQANRIMARSPGYRKADRHQVFDLLDRTEALPGLTAKAPTDDRRPPVFLVGFPRSGTTLLGRILDAHPALALMEERPPLRKALEHFRASNLSYPEALAEMPDDVLAACRSVYREHADQETGTGADAKTVLDKLPLNILYLPLIRMLFPRARIIHAVRHPMDAVLSAYMQNFAANAAMKNFLDIDHAASLFARIDAVLAGRADLWGDRVEILRYEDVVTDFEGTIRPLLAWLKLDWDEGITRYREKAQQAGRIGTPSYEQVVRPLYTSSIGRWKNYADQLADIRPVLTPAVKRLGYSF